MIDRDRRRGTRPVVYPPPRRPSLLYWLALPLGLAVILVAAGIGAVALAAVFSVTPHATDPRRSDVDAAKALIEAADAPMVRSVEVGPGLFDRRILRVALVRRAWTDEARAAWCDVILPTGIGREWVEVTGGGGVWRAPADCDDPASKPDFWAPYD